MGKCNWLSLSFSKISLLTKYGNEFEKKTSTNHLITIISQFLLLFFSVSTSRFITYVRLMSPRDWLILIIDEIITGFFVVYTLKTIKSLNWLTLMMHKMGSCVVVFDKSDFCRYLFILQSSHIQNRSMKKNNIKRGFNGVFCFCFRLI